MGLIPRCLPYIVLYNVCSSYAIPSEQPMSVHVTHAKYRSHKKFHVNWDISFILWPFQKGNNFSLRKKVPGTSTSMKHNQTAAARASIQRNSSSWNILGKSWRKTQFCGLVTSCGARWRIRPTVTLFGDEPDFTSVHKRTDSVRFATSSTRITWQFLDTIYFTTLHILRQHILNICPIRKESMRAYSKTVQQLEGR